MAKEDNPKIISKKHLARLEKERIQNRYIMIASIVVLVLVLAIVGYGILDQTILTGLKPVAIVGPDKITTNEFQKTVRYSRWQMVQQYDSTLQLSQSFGSNPQFANYFKSSLDQIQSELTDPKTVGSAVLDQLIDDRLIRQEAKKRGIVVTSVEIDKAVQEWFNYYANGTPTPTVTPVELPTSTLSPAQLAMVATLTPTIDLTATATPQVESPTATLEPTAVATQAGTPAATEQVAPTPTEYTLKGYQDTVAKYLDRVSATKFTEADLRRVFESSLYRKKLEADITKDLSQVQDQVWARHILVNDEASALKVIERYNAGENWAALAAEYSIDTSNKDNGGDLGWFGPGAMVAPFDTAAFSTPVGSISAPVKTEFGWHIIQVVAHEEKTLTPDQFVTLKDKTFKDWLTAAKAATTITKTDYWMSVVPSDPSITN
jgi:parvulin-like peptidyl-prolyl isomerase